MFPSCFLRSSSAGVRFWPGYISTNNSVLPRRKTGSRTTPEVITVGYWQDVKPILETRCIVCHGCYDAPCQLDLSATEGIERGANKELVYNAGRLLAVEPTRLFVDAQSPAEWRKKQFYPVLNERVQTKEANLNGVLSGLPARSSAPASAGCAGFGRRHDPRGDPGLRSAGARGPRRSALPGARGGRGRTACLAALVERRTLRRLLRPRRVHRAGRGRAGGRRHRAGGDGGLHDRAGRADVRAPSPGGS